ncbi:uncharacterized protein BO80DRAFT_422001 [Aspergillus ibericus CBS 121593]|uniref:Protein kinase domain-containing protein n=1 Tax=Aspergillus ibericus CBS 121593 TaxID=1448316 RepID=A0A395H9X2_9EURO|nr:hypothetical protein BO80DRAFT_422001 [Aspergillus ibericus CBS 121593]RAL04761.1 hypothetical protein BO80DRAFT_422001 [Aspergillus ibericus CBS 121593]
MNTKADLIGIGRTGCVMRYGDVAVKTTNKWTVPADASEYTTIVYQQMNRSNEEALKHEGRIYAHLIHVEGVLKPFEISDTEIRMPYVSHRSLDRYLSANKDTVTNIQRLLWFRSAAEIISRVHRQRVLVADIAARNFLVNADLSLQLCDFSESIVIPVNQDLNEFVSESFLTIKFDIARFGSMLFEIVSGHRYEFYVSPEIEVDLEDGESKTYRQWPTEEKLPDTKDLFLGDIIRKCWLEEGFHSMNDVCAALYCARAPEEEADVMLDWRYLLGVASPMIIFTILVVRRFPWQKALDALSFNRAGG